MLRERYPFYLAGEAVPANADLVVHSKTDGSPLTRVARANRESVAAALAKGTEAKAAFAKWPAWRRAGVLRQVHGALDGRREEFARTLALEAGKPIRDARVEVERALDTLAISANEATGQGGEYLDLDQAPGSGPWTAITRRFPIGLCAFITPFNFPLNLVLHKVAPALAAGCCFVLKPASTTPISALLVAELLSDTELPPGVFSVLPTGHREAAPMIEDERVALLSFTGSPDVGWDLRGRAGSKRISLELGGNAGCIVDRDADLAHAAERIAKGGFGQAGQSCISVQRVYVHRDVYGELRERLVALAKGLVVGDPLDERTDVGPLIDEGEARRVETWIKEAVERGAALLCGGGRRGPFVDPAVLEGVPDDVPLSCREVFGPVVLLESFDEFEGALEKVDASRFGLQAGVFTASLERALLAFERLEVGAVVVGDVPTVRPDAMPYGGAKRSGLGREGPRYAIHEYTEPRTLLLRRPN